MIPAQMITAQVGQNVTLDCIIEASPSAQHQWIDANGEQISDDLMDEASHQHHRPWQTGQSRDGHVTVDNRRKFAINVVRAHRFKLYNKLTIFNVAYSNAGQYICMAKNDLGETRGELTLHGMLF